MGEKILNFLRVLQKRDKGDTSTAWSGWKMGKTTLYIDSLTVIINIFSSQTQEAYKEHFNQWKQCCFLPCPEMQYLSWP